LYRKVAIGNSTSANGGVIDHGARGLRLWLRHWLVIWSDHGNTMFGYQFYRLKKC